MVGIEKVRRIKIKLADPLIHLDCISVKNSDDLRNLDDQLDKIFVDIGIA